MRNEDKTLVTLVVDSLPADKVRTEWVRTAVEIQALPVATIDKHAHNAARFALMAFGEMEV